MQAHSQGILRFDSESRSDERWRLREALLLEILERENLTSLRKLLHASEIAAAQYTNPAGFKHHTAAAERQYRHITKLLCPYMQTKGDSVPETTVDRLMHAWEAEFGSMADPETQRKIDRTIEALNNG